MGFVDEAAREAEGAIARMVEAAREARALHARAELLRHMQTTASKMKGRPRAEAVAGVVGEWMAAWGVEDARGLAGESGLAVAMRAFTGAFHDLAGTADAGEANAAQAAEARLREATAALEDAFAASGTSLSDQMAWRSECAHGWWALVAPPPAALPSRVSVPRPEPGRPFWEAGCAPHCR